MRFSGILQNFRRRIAPPSGKEMLQVSVNDIPADTDSGVSILCCRLTISLAGRVAIADKFIKVLTCNLAVEYRFDFYQSRLNSHEPLHSAHSPIQP